MSTTDFDELETNAVTAALMERSQRLGKAIKRLLTQPQTDAQAFALATNRQALRHTELALLKVNGSLPDEPEQIDPVTAGKAYAELGYHAAQAAYR